ncbi:MAG: methionyl-tRNA formyltransferase [Bacteroidota bacterium]|nr:methionyl-tRNA formyltransferase [Bacteroidota bacterium]
MKSFRVVFMGTPEFAVATLDAINSSNHKLVGVVTVADKAAGRGLILNESQVKRRALELNLPVLQPTNLKNEAFLLELSALKADVFVVVAFRMLPEVVWNMPPIGSINLHGSLLPQYRGAAPINWAIINGESVTGVTTFKLQQQIDTGNLLMQKEINIPLNYSAGDLHDEMMDIGAKVMVQTLDSIANGTQKESKQVISLELKPAPKLNKENTKIDFTKPISQILNLVRGLSPYPVAYTQLNGKQLKVYKAQVKYSDTIEEPGQAVIIDNKLAFTALDGYVFPIILQLEGKKKMEIAEFMNGYKAMIK